MGYLSDHIIWHGKAIRCYVIFVQESLSKSSFFEQPHTFTEENVFHLLTHWGRNKMAIILQKFFPKGHTGNMWALIGLMAWCHAGYKPSSKPMVTNMQDKADTKIFPRNWWVPSRSSQRASNVENLSMSRNHHYRKTSSIIRTKSQSLNGSCILVQLSSLNPAPTGDAPTTSELSTILLPTKVRLILEILQ